MQRSVEMQWLIEEEARHRGEAEDEEAEEAEAGADKPVDENEDPTLPAPPLALLKRLRSSSPSALKSTRFSQSFTHRRGKPLAALPRSDSAVATSALKRRDGRPREHLSMRRLAGRRPPPPPIAGAITTGTLPPGTSAAYHPFLPSVGAPPNTLPELPSVLGSPHRSAPPETANSPGLFSPGSPSLCV